MYINITDFQFFKQKKTAMIFQKNEISLLLKLENKLLLFRFYNSNSRN